MGNYVQPIRDPVLVRDIAQYLKKKDEKYYIMYLIGIYLGRRITDILSLKVKDVRDKDCFKIRERKKGKLIRLEINTELKQALSKYCQGKDDNEYLIKSREGENQPISRERAWQVMKEAAKAFNLDRIGTHTLRKVFGYHIWVNSNRNTTLARQALGHEDDNDTITYLGIDQQTVNRAVKSLKF